MSVHTDRAISLSALAFIFSELVQYQTIKICNANDLELALDRVGRTIGTKVLELLSYRERLTKREDGVISMLQVRLRDRPTYATNSSFSLSLQLAGKSYLAKQQIL